METRNDDSFAVIENAQDVLKSKHLKPVENEINNSNSNQTVGHRTIDERIVNNYYM